MKIEIITQADEELYEAFQRLVPQLTSNAAPPSRAELSALAGDTASTLIVARGADGKIIAALIQEGREIVGRLVITSLRPGEERTDVRKDDFYGRVQGMAILTGQRGQ